MNTALWIVQIALALIFAMAGFMKLSQPKAKLAERMAWVKDFEQSRLRLIGVLELLAAIGLILPQATGILPWLTPLAAVGLVFTMIGAALTHARHGEGIIINVVLLLLAAFVAIGRFWLVPVV